MIDSTQYIGISISYGEYRTRRFSKNDMILLATFLSDSGGFQDSPKMETLIPVILLPISLKFIFIGLMFEDLKVSKNTGYSPLPSLLQLFLAGVLPVGWLCSSL